ncbi:hypothetical protein ACHAW6_002234 [Cyclotella cf. meneghiniana]
MGAKYLEIGHKEVQMMAEQPLPIPTHESFLKNFNSAIGATIQQFKRNSKNDSNLGTEMGANPAEIHFQAVKHTIKHLVTTCKDGINFWQTMPLMTLPEHPLPICAISLHGQLQPHAHQPQHKNLDMHAYVDSDWATYPKTHHSFMVIIAKLAGGTIAYKTKLQSKFVLSSMEATFMAACNVGKMILLNDTLH